MSQQLINIGSVPNDGTGDTLRAAGQKINDNFTELYTGKLDVADNLSDVASAATARTNLGLGTAAVHNVGTSGANVPLLSAENTWSAAQVSSVASNNSVWRHEPSGGSFKFQWGYVSHLLTGGPVGEEEYTNENWVFGVNVAAGGGGRIDNSKSALYLAWESRFYNGARFVSEFHLEHFTTDGASHRLWTWMIPETGSTGTSFAQQIDIINFHDYSGVLKVQFNLGTNQISVYSGICFTKETNNQIWLKQRNAAGTSYVNLPFIDSDDRLRSSSPGAYFIGGRPSGGIFFTIQPTGTWNNGDRIVYVPGPVVTGSMHAVVLEGAPTTGLYSHLWNNSNNSTAHAAYTIRTIGAGGGDPFINVIINGVTQFSFGIDNSDSDRFKISAAGALGSNDALAINPGTLATTFYGLVQLGGVSSSFPAWKRSSTVVQGRLADDSDFCPVQGQLRVHANATMETITPDRTIRLFDAAGVEYKVPCAVA